MIGHLASESIDAFWLEIDLNGHALASRTAEAPYAPGRVREEVEETGFLHFG